MLTIKNLHCKIEDKAILQGVNLNVGAGEIHAIMGPNGSGKSTLSSVLAGHDAFDVTGGTVDYNDQDLLEMDITERALAGIFLAFQYPIALPGVTCSNFLRQAINAQRAHHGEEELDALLFAKMLREAAPKLGISTDMLKRGVNDGFSGGEKKRLETLQMLMLQPQLVIMDETDSGLDVDAMKLIADNVNQLRSAKRSFIIITHYQRLLDYITPDYVHILSAGKIIKSGDAKLAQMVENDGYQNFVAG